MNGYNLSSKTSYIGAAESSSLIYFNNCKIDRVVQVAGVWMSCQVGFAECYKSWTYDEPLHFNTHHSCDPFPHNLWTAKWNGENDLNVTVLVTFLNGWWEYEAT